MKYSSICDLTESDRQKAISELNESDDFESRISSLRDKIKASDWFNAVFEERLDDQYLKRYLRVAKMDEEIALERIRKMFALQKEWHELFGDFTFTSIEGLIKSQLIQVMPSRDPSDNSVILYLQMGKWDPTKFSIHQVYRSVIFVEEILLLSDPIQINGIKLLGNASDASLKHLKAMERRAIKLWGEATGKTIPLRMKKICMYNFPIFLNAIINIFKMILPKKLTERLVMIGTDKTKLQEHLPNCCLPQALGGDVPEENSHHFYEFCRENAPIVEEKYQYLKSWSKQESSL